MQFETMPGSRVGQMAPALTINDQSGRVISLEQFRGSWLLLVLHRHLA